MMKSVDEVIAGLTEAHKPATPKQVAAFCKKIKFEPPKDYVEFVSKSNGGEFGGAIDRVQLYSLADALEHTKGYDFPEVAPDLVIIGTDGSGMAYCMDGRYRPARIIQTDLADPGRIGDSMDYGDSFVGFIERLKGSSPARGLPPLPGAAPASEIRRIPFDDLGPLRIGEDRRSVWTRTTTHFVQLSIPEGAELVRFPQPHCSKFIPLPGGRILCNVVEGNQDKVVRIDSDGQRKSVSDGYLCGTTNSGAAAVVQDTAVKRVVDIESGKELHRSNVTAHYRFSPDGRWLVEHSDETKKLTLTDLQNNQVAWSVKATGTKLVPDFIFSNDGKTIWGLDHGKRLFAWEMTSGRLKFKCGDREHPVRGDLGGDFAEVPTTGDLVTCHAERGILVLWSAVDGTPKAKLVVNEVKDGRPNAPLCMADGKHVVFGTQNSVMLWDISGQ